MDTFELRTPACVTKTEPGCPPVSDVGANGDGKPSMFTIHEFAHMTNTSITTLRYYDSVGLLKPFRCADNGYRYYSHKQFTAMNVIKTCRRLGVSIEEAKRYYKGRNPAYALEMLAEQIGKLNAEIQTSMKAIALLTTISAAIREVANTDESSVTIERLPAKRIILGPVNDYTDGRDVNMELRRFYMHFQDKEHGADIDFPVWGVFSEERVKSGNWKYPDRFYFNNPAGTDERPSGLYAVGYGRGDYGATDDVYVRTLAYIAEAGYEVCGPAYEEYPLNEISVSDPNSYLIRLIIAVRERVV